ncbi:MAG: efflux RND transporter periplasmic adaptor subunit [Desulfobacteraceae bacterium]|nr:efflux RND transporter periplasmic adaptor subunit [Desulfobacteraceae bacterium]
MGLINRREEIVNTLGLDPGLVKSKMGRRGLVLALIALPVLLIVLLGLSGKGKARIHYKTEPVERGDLSIVISATGNLTPTNKVDVGCEVSGIIKSVAVDFNDHVKAGQVLARLDDTQFLAAVAQSKASLASAEAKLAQAQTSTELKSQNLKRMRQVFELSEGKAPSQGEMEAAQADLLRAQADEEAAKALIQQAQARLKIDETSLSKTTIVSPIKGVVLKRSIDPGQTVAAAFQTPVLFSLADDLTKLELQVDVDEADVGQVLEGKEATFTVESHPDRLFKARIVQQRYNPQITNGVVTYPTLLKVDNPDLLLRPGMTATVKMVATNLSNTIKIPNAALRFSPSRQSDTTEKRGLFKSRNGAADSTGEAQLKSPLKTGQSLVWVLQNGRPTAMAVTAGLTDGVYTAMIDGDLQPGTPVVVDTAAAE